MAPAPRAVERVAGCSGSGSSRLILASFSFKMLQKTMKIGALRLKTLSVGPLRGLESADRCCFGRLSHPKAPPQNPLDTVGNVSGLGASCEAYEVMEKAQI